jgi:hypothetical protein
MGFSDFDIFLPRVPSGTLLKHIPNEKPTKSFYYQQSVTTVVTYER